MQIQGQYRSKTYTRPRVPIVATIAGVVATVLMPFPLYWMIANSLETNQEIFSIPLSLIPTSVTLTPYATALATQIPHLITSIIVALGTVIVSLLIALPAGYALAHF